MDRQHEPYNLFDELNDRLAVLEQTPPPGALLIAGLWNLTGDELEFTIFDAQARQQQEEPLLTRELGRAA